MWAVVASVVHVDTIRLLVELLMYLLQGDATFSSGDPGLARTVHDDALLQPETIRLIFRIIRFSDV